MSRARKSWATGRTSQTDAGVPRGNTLFEIGSISEVFTGLLLAQMVAEKAVELTDPVETLLGASITVPRSGKHQITLLDLATHQALPRTPGNFHPKDPHQSVRRLLGRTVARVSLEMQA